MPSPSFSVAQTTPAVATKKVAIPSPADLRKKVGISAPVSQETPETAPIDPDLQAILERNRTKETPAIGQTEIKAAPKPTTGQRITRFFRDTPVLKDITEALFGIPESERMAFEPSSSAADSMTFEEYLTTEDAKKVLEKAQKAAEKRGTPLTVDQKEDVLDFAYNQDKHETKIANQGLLGFLYENLLKSDVAKVEDRYEKLRLAGVPEDRASQVAIQDVFEGNKNFNEQIRESVAQNLAKEQGIAYTPAGSVEITDAEREILKGEGLKEAALQGLESLDFIGIGSIARKGITTIGEPALRELSKLASRDEIFKFVDNLFNKVDDVPPNLVEEITDAVFEVQKAGGNQLAGTQTKIDEAIARVLRESGKSSVVSRKAGETVIELNNLVRDGARASSEVANFADELSDIAKNSLKNDRTGVREAALKALRETPDEAARGEVRLRQLEDGSVVIEDGRHRLEVARETGVLPRIVDVSEQYDPKVVPDKVQELIRKYDALEGSFADDTAVGAKFAGENVRDVAAKGADDVLDVGADIRKGLDEEIAAAPENVRPRLESAAQKAQQFERADDFVNSFGTGGANAGGEGFTEAKAIAEYTQSGNLSDFFYRANNLPVPVESTLRNANPQLYKQAEKSGTVEDFFKTITKGEGELSDGTKASLGDFFRRVKEEIAQAPASTKAPVRRKVVPKSKEGTAPAEKADDLRTALTNPERVAEEAVKTQRRISGTEPDGVKTAAKLGQAKEIPKTPAKAARFAVKNDPPLEIPDETRLAWLQRKIQDKFNRLSLIQRKVGSGVPLSDDLNAYLQQEMFHGRAAERLDRFEDAIISSKGKGKQKALLERMAADNITLDEMGEFLHAKHAPARNERVAKINPDIPDGGSGLTNAEAAKIINKYKANGKLEKMEAYATEVYEKITKARIKILEEEHLLKPEAVEKIVGSFKDDTYVPLKLPVEPEFRLRGGAGFDVRGKDVKRLKGSTQQKRVNPLVQAIVDYEDAVIKAEKNKVGRSLKKLIEQNPNVKNSQGEKIWEVKAQQYMPQYNKFGEVEYVKPVGYKLDDNVMEVRDQGKIYHITLHDKALASAMKNLGSERGVAFLHQINNYLRAVITFYNPEFMITNFERDLQTALINTGGEQGAIAAGRVARDVKAALGGIWRETRGIGSKKNLAEGATDWAKEYAELKEVGGRVGWFDYLTVAEKQKQIQRRINTATGKTRLDRAARTWDGVAEWVSDINESVESGVRLSAYVNAKKAGLSKEQAASLAKNLTVNFNKKGEWGAAVNSLYLFANAGIQGTTRLFKALKHKRTRRIVAGIAAFSFGVEYMNRQINEEAYDKISDYEKNTNLIFMLPTGSAAPVIDASIGSVEQIPNTDEKYIKLKLPYGYNVFKVLGDVAYDVGVEQEHWGEGLKRLVFAMEESFNPLSSGSAAQFISPTITDPLVQMYENKNYFGSPIRPDDDPYAPAGKESDKYFSTVREPSKIFTEFLNGVSGGNEVEAGVLDFSPENVDHIIDFLGGGVGKFIANTIETGTKLAMGEVPEIENTPFIRKFVGDVYDDVERQLFYDLVKRGETRLLNEKEIADLKKYGKEAMNEGQLDNKKATTAITNFLKSQNRIHAGRVFEKIKNLDTPEERREVYNAYIEKNGLEKRSEGITEELKDVISGYKAKQGNEGERGFIGTVVDGGRGLFIDPQNVLKAMLTEEKLGKVEGNLVELQRFYGLEYTDEGGSQEKKRSMLQKAGISPTDANMKAYKLEHIVPVKAGGDTSDSNLRVIPTAEHEAYTPIDVAVAAAVQAGKLTRGEASSIMKRLKVDKSITPQQAYEEVKAKAQ